MSLPIGSRDRRSANKLSATIIAAAALFKPGALPAVLVPLPRKAGRSLANTSTVGSGLARPLGPRSLVRAKCHHALLAASLHRHDLVHKLARLLGLAEALLGTGSEAVLRLARYLRLRHEIFRMPARMFAGKGIVETVAE